METMLTIADQLSALGNEARLTIVKHLLQAFPESLSVGEIQKKLGGMPGATLNHHLEKLKAEKLVVAKKEKQWNLVQVNAQTLCNLMNFFCSECCNKNQVLQTNEGGKTKFSCC